MPDTKVCPQCHTHYGQEHRFCTIDGAALVALDPSGELVGTVIAERYHIIAKLGTGGMGEVYLAEHVRMKRKSAVKVMRSSMMGDASAIGRFNREAENASQIAHPNVAAIYDFGETKGGMIYLAMEYIDGEPLSKILEREGALHAVRATDIIVQAAEGLSVAHGLGILHRDLKPDNIMIAKARGGTDLVKIVDFGIAKIMHSDEQRVTSTGLIVGTPEYMSPEQFSGDVLDARSDIYALGLIAFHVLTGKYAFPSPTSKESLIARLTQRPRTLQEAKADVEWPETLQEVFNRALAADPSERYDDVVTFARELDHAIASMEPTQTAEIYLRAIASRSNTPSRSLSPTYSQTPPRPQMSLRDMPAVTVRDDEVVAFSTVGATGTVDREASVTGATVAEAPAESAIAAPTGRGGRGRIAIAAGALVLIAAVAMLFTRDRGASGTVVPTGADSIVAEPPASVPATVGTDSAPAPVVAALSPVPPRADSAAAKDSAAKDSASLLAIDDQALVRRFRSGVFTVSSSAGAGTGFLADPLGIVLTDSRVLPRTGTVEVQLDPSTKVRARVIAIDTTLRVATLAIAMTRCPRCAAMVPAPDTAARAAGDSVATLSAAPLRASVRAAKGAIERVEAGSGGALRTTVKLPARGTGGPVLSRSGALLGLALPRGATELASAVPVSAIRTKIAFARSLLQSGAVPAPSDSLVPMIPATAFPQNAVRAAAERASYDLAPYRVGKESFNVLAMTPQVMAWRDAQLRAALAAERSAGRPAPGDRIDPIQGWRGWDGYVRDRRAAVVLNVMPDRATFPFFKPAGTVDFKNGDLASEFQLLRDGAPVEPIETARIPAVVNEPEYATARRRVFYQGIGVFRIDDFAPRADGGTPSFQIVVVDASRRNRQVRIDLPPALIGAIRSDFTGFQSGR